MGLKSVRSTHTQEALGRPSKIDGLHFEPKAHEKIAKKIFELLNGELC